ncbi:hypothetical protein KQ302_00485 [Synechococcus sp. CS-602]|uniref:hypothetical protein n=1 Tax=Synechococcaceae TaxID=1890426 RepID=UPI0008FF07F2|nr:MULTISPECIES: hypothetical protein [Synechococcaceae]MCT4365621.1 hypothetical protein [Candidatus Regnicoccus frigidus MAG-AL1]APD47389.1 hypothetical protein BM449_02615 [Synechococcus sp. SynAce01]MCT0202689.1 hypothetical protein [Synechococcus sp. CS-603]MCT0203600.1 hypothetical protein [Synechococcus sp. CS-602]MCT0246045.1 hypothetical protein [Synechococcus sp. CS-601]
MNLLSEPGFKAGQDRKVFRKRRRRSPWRELLLALLNIGIGAGILLLLIQLPERLDSLLLVSKVISVLLKGISQIGQGIVALAAGLLQTLGILVVVSLAIAAMLLLANGLFRILRMALPGVGGVFRVPAELARMLWSVVQIRKPDRDDP